jgi:hypothetical protein
LLLAWVYFSGYDLRFHILKLICDTRGIKTLFWFVVNPLMHHWFSINEPGLSWWSLVYIPLALHLHPTRSRWWLVPLVLWLAIRPALCFQAVARPGPVVGSLVTSLALDPHSAALCLFGAADLLLIGLIFRSRLVIFSTAATIAFIVMVAKFLNARPTSIPAWAWPAMVNTWHAGVGLPMLWWAARERWRFSRSGHCKLCGYDLTGLAIAQCPECGTHDETTGVHSTP